MQLYQSLISSNLQRHWTKLEATMAFFGLRPKSSNKKVSNEEGFKKKEILHFHIPGYQQSIPCK